MCGGSGQQHVGQNHNIPMANIKRKDEILVNDTNKSKLLGQGIVFGDRLLIVSSEPFAYPPAVKKANIKMHRTVMFVVLYVYLQLRLLR
jgi:hypothetical protein